ncbi:MAG: AAA family ATPase [Actinobacteria bacterium]|uniref:DNA 3'-5' helicase n=1 Tax=freshwater metagenome TaxID=449393 RepID=A0A6J7B0A3_9ZZZZ|nr:AAA family ATPase [Actinomycetota bacterium]
MSLDAQYSPEQIIALLQKNLKAGEFIAPVTEHQSEIISSDLEPAVVIAGAGSGKTETMSNRVLYLVANGFVTPDQILGLTFTRKAAGELSVRVRKRLRQLSALAEFKHITSTATSVTTYHSYAGKLLSEHAIRCGFDADAEPLGEAAIWQIASDVVRNWSDDSYRNQSAVSTVIKDLLGLSKLMMEHQVSGTDIQAIGEEIMQELDMLAGAPNDEVRAVHRAMLQRNSLLPMVEAFMQRRRAAGEFSFDDQMSLAADIAQNFADVGVLERGKYRVVLLDEYQDTSQSQVRMLSSLYGGGHPVMAVGDPSQAIYTWRGASAGTMASFTSYFPKAEAQSGKELFTLPRTFRNDATILAAANRISEKIKSDGGQQVVQLEARPNAGKGEIAYGIFETIDAEAAAVAEYINANWSPTSGKTAAVLVRKRAQITAIENALRHLGLPVEVIGIGGLIHVPEVADFVSLLKIITNPDAGSSVMRHLTGPRINLGPRDIAALGAFSRERAKTLHADSKSFIKKIAAGNPEQLEADDQFSGSIIDALDEIHSAKKSEFSDVGYQRLVRFAGDLRRLRSRAGGQISDVISEIESYLTLESEITLRDGSSIARRHLDRFLDEATKFERSGGSITAFLDWLDIAADAEGGLKAGAPEIRSDVVQILTIHMAKGAEWDVVAVPGLAQGTFPGSNTTDPDNWIKNEKHIPFPLRGDAKELPVFSLHGVTKNSEAAKVIKAYGGLCVENIKLREEMRLAYVAVTRAKSHLICTTSRWRDGAKAVEPSEIFYLIAEVASALGGLMVSDAPAPDADAENPTLENPMSATWPFDPLGDRRTAFDEAIALVAQSAAHDLADSTDQRIASWINDAQALITEQHQRNVGITNVALPPRLSTSTLVALHENPHELALNIRRPMPRGQDQYSRRGTAFHLWVERQFTDAATLFGDEYLDYLDPLEDDSQLEDLKKAWLSSEFANRTPVRVEVPFETTIAGVLIRGRIDAVYATSTGFEVIDWKTGSKKLGQSAAIQLAMYRLAWAKLSGADISNVSAAFHYVPTSVTDRPADLLDEDELVALISRLDEQD